MFKNLSVRWLSLSSLTLSLAACATPPPQQTAIPAGAEFLKNYFGNTLVCAATETGEDVCHYWLNPDGTFVIVDSGGPHKGHWKLGPKRADGKTPVCQYWDSSEPVLPPELKTDSFLPPGAIAAAGGSKADQQPQLNPDSGGQMVCATNMQYMMTICKPVPVSKLPPEAAKTSFLQGMFDRFHNGMCYPHNPQNVGDVWFEPDDPLPNQGGLDKLMLIEGRR